MEKEEKAKEIQALKEKHANEIKVKTKALEKQKGKDKEIKNKNEEITRLENENKSAENKRAELATVLEKEKQSKAKQIQALNESHKKELKVKNDEIKDAKDKLVNKDDEIKRLKGIENQIKEEKMDSQRKILEMETKVKEITQTASDLQREKAAKSKLIKDMKEEYSKLQNSLASEMNAKVSANEEALENISIKCRPMNIAESYNIFVSNTWLDAKQVLDEAKGFTEENRIGFLCDILMKSNACALERFAYIMSTLKQLAFDPFGTSRDSLTPKENAKGTSTAKEASLPVIIQSTFGDHLRKQVMEVDIAPLTHDIEKAVATNSKTERLLQNKHVKAYITGSANLAWQMVIQRPQMKFLQPDLNKPFKGESVHPLAWGSKPDKNAKIKYYWYPSLYHGDTTMVAGKVFVDK